MGAAARGAGWRHAASLVRTLVRHAEQGKARIGAEPAAADPRRPHPTHPGTRAVAAAGRSQRLQDAVVPATVAPDTPIAPTAPRPARRTAGTLHAGTVVTVLPVSPSPPALSCYYVDPDQTVGVVNVGSVVLPTSTPWSP